MTAKNFVVVIPNMSKENMIMALNAVKNKQIGYKKKRLNYMAPQRVQMCLKDMLKMGEMKTSSLM